MTEVFEVAHGMWTGKLPCSDEQRKIAIDVCISYLWTFLQEAEFRLYEAFQQFNIDD